MTTAQILSDELVEFILEESCITNYKITPDTKIVADLGMDGDDGVEFVIAYGKKFKVDLSGFMADKYFAAEGLQFVTVLLERLGFKKNRLKPLMVKHLQLGISLGYLNEMAIDSLR